MSLHAYEGNKTRVLLGKHELHLIQNVRVMDDYSPEPAQGIGNIKALEYVPTFARYTITTAGVLERNQGLVDDGIYPENAEEALKAQTFDIEIFDKQTGSLLKRYEKALCAQVSVTVRLHTLTLTDATFVAIDTGGGLQ